MSGLRALRLRLEAAAAAAALALFAALSLDRASALGGWIGRSLGPRLGVTRVARRNIAAALPEKSPAEIEAIVCAMWDNLGRTAAEYAHLDAFRCYEPGGRVQVVGVEYIDRLRDSPRGGIFFSGHLANWEVLPLAAVQRGIALTQVYRAANNPHAEAIIQRARRQTRGHHVPKGAAGARQVLKALRSGGVLAMLIDQKMNDGIAVPFFGRDAMTAPALAEFALRHGCPVVPARIERLGGARFRLTAFPPLEVVRTGDNAADVRALMTAVNALLESWVRERPAEWLWLHRRWPG